MNEYEQIATAFWTKEADKIIAAYPDKHREYHSAVLKGTWERGWLEALQWAESQITTDGNPELVLEKIGREIKRMIEPSNDRTHTRRASDVNRESGTECAIRRCVQ